MQFTSFIVALVLLAIGLFLIYYFCSVLFSPLLSYLRKGGKLSVFRKAEAHLKKADRFIEKEDYKKALRELKKALVFKLCNPSLANALKEHHQNILSRCLIIAEEHSARALHVAEVEKLFLARAELLVLYLNAKNSYSRIHSKRQEQGRSLPNWSVEDYKRRTADIEKELAKNLKELEAALDELFLEVGGSGKNDEIVYH